MRSKFLCALSLIMLCFPLQAHAQEISSKVKIEVEYSEGIIPQNSDEFIIFYKGNGNEKKIELNASHLLKEQNTIFLEEGEYEITDIEYKGENEKIKEQGYVVSDSFQALQGKEAYDQIYIGIGSEAGSTIMEKETVVSKLAQKSPIKTDSGKKEMKEEAPERSTEETKETSKNIDKKTTQKDMVEKESAKVSSSKSTAIKLSPIKKGIPLLILMIATFGTVWYFHKKGKI